MAYRRTEAIQHRLDAQRDAIVAATSDLLAEQGYAGCSVVAVAARAGVSVGGVYTHFGSKGALVAEVFRTVVTREVAAVRSAAAVEGDIATQVAAFVETFAGRALKSPRLAYALIAEPVDEDVDALRLEFRHAFRDVIGSTIARGVADGSLPPQNADVTASALVGAVGEALVGPLAGDASSPDTVAELIRFAIRALGVRDADNP